MAKKTITKKAQAKAPAKKVSAKAPAKKAPAKKVPTKKAPAKASAKKVQIVEGVRLDKVDETTLFAAYRKERVACEAMADPPMGLPDEEGLDTAGLVSNLVLWYRAVTPKEELCDCSTCGGDSDARLDACPFCGDTEETDMVVGQEEDVGQGAEGTVQGSEPEPKPSKPGRRIVHASEPELVEAEVVEVVDKNAMEVDELDKMLVDIHQLKAQSATSIWELGTKIKELIDTGKWRFRLDDNGRTKYRTFPQFCKAELGMGYTQANRLVKVAEQFPRDQMERLGIAKCSVMLYLPKEVRDQLATGAENKSVSQLSKEAQELRDGETSPSTPRGSLTVAMAPGVVEIPLLARPKVNARKASDKPAKSLSEDPWAVEQLPNKVHCYYSVTKNKDGNLVLAIDRRRVTREDVVQNTVEDAE